MYTVHVNRDKISYEIVLLRYSREIVFIAINKYFSGFFNCREMSRQNCVLLYGRGRRRKGRVEREGRRRRGGEWREGGGKKEVHRRKEEGRGKGAIEMVITLSLLHVLVTIVLMLAASHKI